MRHTSHTIETPADVLRILRAYPLRWVLPALAIGCLGLVYSLLKQDTWEAVQGLIVRNEAHGNLDGPGKFRAPADMKVTQETMLEMVKSRGVLTRALMHVGPSLNVIPKGVWPSADDVAGLAGSIKLSPPKGAEFGTTEVFYLKVKDADRERAEALCDAVCRQLQLELQNLRDRKAQSMIDELEKTVSLAQSDLDQATEPLHKLEQEVGGDLAELRVLHESTSGESDLRRKTLEMENELRQATLAHHSNEELFKLLTEARQDQSRLLATPNRLLESQPALKRWKEGLVDAQLKTAQLLGTMSQQHPLVVASLATEREVSQHLHDELALAVRGLELDLRLSADRVASLEGQVQSSRSRLQRLAGLRTTYANLVAEARHRTRLLEDAEKDLGEARASQAGAHSASLLSALDIPDAGMRPIGPSKSMLMLAGLFGGLVVGVGVVVLTVQPAKEVQSSAEGTAAEAALRRSALVPAAPQVAAGGLSFRVALDKTVPNCGR